MKESAISNSGKWHRSRKPEDNDVESLVLYMGSGQEDLLRDPAVASSKEYPITISALERRGRKRVQYEDRSEHTKCDNTRKHVLLRCS